MRKYPRGLLQKIESERKKIPSFLPWKDAKNTLDNKNQLNISWRTFIDKKLNCKTQIQHVESNQMIHKIFYNLDCADWFSLLTLVQWLVALQDPSYAIRTILFSKILLNKNENIEVWIKSLKNIPRLIWKKPEHEHFRIFLKFSFSCIFEDWITGDCLSQ